MLTKDLLRHTTHKNQVRPTFIDFQDALLLSVAEQLLAVFETSLGKTREQLLEASKEVIDGNPCEAIITRGLEKLLLDQTEFDTTTDAELLEMREKLFLHTSQLLSNQCFGDLRDYHQQVEKVFAQNQEEIAQQLYADLPPYQPVLSFKSYSAENLLHRYNCAQVQGLLLRSDYLQLSISEKDPVLLRQLCKYLRFHQLLAEIVPDSEKGYRITIDGPLSLFSQTQKYGVNLANFFPAILHQPQWQLQAQIQLTKQKTYQLCLDQSCQIRSHYHQFLAYLPQEIEMFQQTFQQKSEFWKVAPAKQFIPLKGEFYCFPDYVFQHESGVMVAMELFHAWHASHLTNRLGQLAQFTTPPLILGMAKSLLKNSRVAQRVAESPYFSQCGFVFREMPTADQVLPILEQFVDKLPLFSQKENL